jgi:transposase
VSAASSPTRRLLPVGLQPESVLVGPSGLTVRAGVVAAYARCPVCERRSQRVHSQYERTVSDLPWRGISVTLKVRARRFFCANKECERSIFCERLPEISAHARKTNRLEETLTMIAFELGGEAGARLAHELGLPVSPDALLERIRHAPRLRAGQVKVLGIDDWAKKKGHSYGTILVDLERHRVVDLLPERTAETLEKWLKAHPNIEVVSRDRYQPYIDGIRAGAPKALQVADRWHLLKNLTDAVERVLERERISLNEALKLTLPEPPYVPQIMAAYIRFWWKYERPEPEQMWEKISQSGFDDRYREAFDYVMGRLREGLPTRRTTQETLRAKTEARRRMPRLVSRLFVRDPDELPDADQEYLRVLKDLNQEVAAAYELAQGFVRMLRGRHPEMLDGWLKEALGSVSPELRSFADGLRADHDAVRAAFSEEWSNGQVEGQVNRLKLLKRQMYGRASFTLLKQRVLYAA